MVDASRAVQNLISRQLTKIRATPDGSGVMGFDIDAYFERIGYSGERAPTLATLAAIHVRHTEAHRV